jgi:glucose-1-phosphate thymidylyltransferase
LYFYDNSVVEIAKNINQVLVENMNHDVNKVYLEKGALKVGILPEERIGWIQGL